MNSPILWNLLLLYPTPSGPTLFSATGGNFSAIHIDYMDFVPELGWRFQSRNL